MAKLLCLDPGHNLRSVNRSPDATYYEWEFAQDVCDKAEAMIKLIPGLDCIKTKEADTFPTSLAGRMKVAHDAKADLFLSQHSNAVAGGWGTPNGFSIHPYPGRHLDLANIALEWCIKLLPMNSRGVQPSNFYVTREARMPSILIETGFHTNREDVAKLKTQSFRILAAKVLVRTACEYLKVEYMEGDNVGDRRYYHLKAKQTLSHVAAIYGVSVPQLRIWNGLTPADDRNLSVGLKLWVEAEKEQPAEPAPPEDGKKDERIAKLEAELVTARGQLAAALTEVENLRKAVTAFAKVYGVKV